MNTIEEFSNLLNKQEALHPELSSCVIQENGWTLLKHPLLYSFPYSPQMNALLNAQFNAKTNMLSKALENKDWSQYIFIHERPYRINAFDEVEERLTDIEYWKTLSEIWSDSENIWQWPVDVSSLLNSARHHKESMMDEDEISFLKSLPEEFVVYRGHQSKNKLGYSWTLSYWHANMFAKRFSNGTSKSYVSRAVCKKKDIHALLMSRGEYEIIVDPDNLSSLKKVDISYWPLDEIKSIAEEKFAIKGRSHHGEWHWNKVDMNAVALAKKTKGADIYVCRLFALLHDCARENENSDPGHGDRAAKFVESLWADKKIKLTLAQKSKLVTACADHNKGLTTEDPTIGCCWDADRMDLIRVGKVPEKKYFSTDAAKELLWKI